MQGCNQGYKQQGPVNSGSFFFFSWHTINPHFTLNTKNMEQTRLWYLVYKYRNGAYLYNVDLNGHYRITYILNQPKVIRFISKKEADSFLKMYKIETLFKAVQI